MNSDDGRGGSGPGSGRPGSDRPGGQRPGDGPRPGLQPTKIASLVLAALLAGVFGWYVMRQYFADIPTLNWLPGTTLAVLAIIEGTAARTTRARIERRPGHPPINPLLTARYAVLAKASSMAGSIFAGAYAGVSIWALSERGVLTAADQNLGWAVAGLVGAVALTAAALLLERACRVPPSPEDKDNESAGGSPTPRR